MNGPLCFLMQSMNEPETLQSPVGQRTLRVCLYVRGTDMEINTYQFHALLMVIGERLLTSVNSSGSNDTHAHTHTYIS
jgi:hypothetical protein